MAKNTQRDMNSKMTVAAGVLAAMAAGAYYLYGTKEGAKKRLKIRGWMLKAKGEMMEKMETMKEINEGKYNELVASVMKKYETLKNLDPKEVAELKADFTKHWKNIRRHIDATNKPAPKKKAMKKAVK